MPHVPAPMWFEGALPCGTRTTRGRHNDIHLVVCARILGEEIARGHAKFRQVAWPSAMRLSHGGRWSGEVLRSVKSALDPKTFSITGICLAQIHAQWTVILPSGSTRPQNECRRAAPASGTRIAPRSWGPSASRESSPPAYGLPCAGVIGERQRHVFGSQMRLPVGKGRRSSSAWQKAWQNPDEWGLNRIFHPIISSSYT